MPLYPRSSWVLRYESRFSDPILSKRRDDRPSAGPTSSAICGAPLVGPLLKSPPPIRTLPDSERSARPPSLTLPHKGGGNSSVPFVPRIHVLRDADRLNPQRSVGSPSCVDFLNRTDVGQARP